MRPEEMLSTDCYPSDVLQCYLRVNIDDTLGDTIELQLRSCEACEDIISELDSVDGRLIRTLQLKREAPNSEPQWIQKVVALDPNQDQAENSTFAPRELPNASSGDCDDTRRFGDYELLGIWPRRNECCVHCPTPALGTGCLLSLIHI